MEQIAMLMVFKSPSILIMLWERFFFFLTFLFFSVSAFRTSDGGKVVGTIEVSVVKMGETEDGETDHITTDMQGQKVGSQPAQGTN